MKLSILTLVLLLVGFSTLPAQVVVDAKNLNEDKDVEYIQFSFYFESKGQQPVYLIDFGMILSDDGEAKKQKITIDEEEITGRMTPAYVLNKLYKSGWEYMGDAVFMRSPMVENTQLYTLRRRSVVKR